MAKIQKIKGLNEKEQRLLETLADQKPYTLKELRELFRHTATRHLRKQEGKHPRGWNSNLQAHSYVRNSIRKLIRHGWAHQVDKGTYELTSKGKKRLESGVCVTTGPSLVEYYKLLKESQKLSEEQAQGKKPKKS